MRKFMSVLLALILLFTTVPFSAFATGDDNAEYNELIDLACEVFPEYVSAIRGETISTFALDNSESHDKVVYSETRKVSDTISMSLTLMSSGEAIVLENNMSSALITMPSSSTTDITTVGVAGTATFRVATNASPSDVFVLSNVSFNIYYDTDWYFTSYGSVTKDTFYKSTLRVQTFESIGYTLRVTPKATDFYALDIYFSNNKLIAEIH